MRANEILHESKKLLYHGSMDDLPVGTILTPGEDDYEENWGNNLWFIALEKYRPMEYRQHSWSVFMVDNEDDVDNAGGGTDYIFTVEPIGEVERHDMNWMSEIGGVLENGGDIESDEVKQLALNYWNGVPHPNENVWEYLAPKARIVASEPF